MKDHGHQPSAAYFTAIDGLRAVAVLSVLFFHLNGLVPAGFVGVDVFFVISGFVVANAAASLPVGSLSGFMAAFYARRLLRIVPALVVCLVVSMALATLFIPGGGWLSATNTKTGMAAFFGFSNVVLSMTAGDYWSPRSEFNPFTHTWSLGVEEQFYLLSPFLLFAWLRGHRRNVAWLLVVLAAVSLVLAGMASTPPARIMAFYGLQARFWELAIGVGLALGLPAWRPFMAALPGPARLGLTGPAVAGLGLAFVATDAKAFPWPWAVLPVLATAVLIASTVAAPQARLSRLLASAPAVWVGKRSYSLYLWHWPVFVLFRWTVGLDGALEQLAALALSFLLAAASFRFVEQPTRHSRTAGATSRWKVAAFGAVALVFCAGTAAGIAASRSWLNLSVTRQLVYWDAYGDLAAPGARCAVIGTEVMTGPVRRQAFEASACTPDGRTVFVAGDSHAGAYTALLKKFVRMSAVNVVLFTGPGCPVFSLGAPQRTGRPECQAFAAAVMRHVADTARPGDVLFLPGLRMPRLRDQWGGAAPVGTPDPAARSQAEAEAIEQLSPLALRGVKVIFEAPKPVFMAPPFRCSDWFNRHNPVCDGGWDMRRADVELRRATALASMRTVTAALQGGKVWDPLEVLCQGETCSSYRDGHPLFFDGDHLSGFGNAVLVDDFSLAMLQR